MHWMKTIYIFLKNNYYFNDSYLGISSFKKKIWMNYLELESIHINHGAYRMTLIKECIIGWLQKFELLVLTYYGRTIIGLNIAIEITRASNVGWSLTEGTTGYHQDRVGKSQEKESVMWVRVFQRCWYGVKTVVDLSGHW